jgi:hypothetical protein
MEKDRQLTFKNNIEARSRKMFAVEKNNKHYIFWVCVCSFSYRAHVPCLYSSVVFPSLQCFPTLFHKGKAVPLQAWSGPEGSRKLSFPDFVTTAQEGGKVVSLTHRPPLLPGNSPGTHFYSRLSRPQGHNAIGRFMSMKNSNDTIWDRTSDLPICSTAP